MAAPPSWLARMTNDVATQMWGVDILAPIGCHYFFNEAVGHWEVTLFVSSTEVVGGARDGQTVTSRFTLDLSQIQGLFDEVTGFHWQAQQLGSEDEIGPHVSLEGKYEGQDVWVRVLASAPNRFEAGRYANAYEMRVQDIW